MDFETDDRTMVAGAPSAAGLRRDEVLGGRYDIRERLRDDAFTLDYRALDKERNERVRLREVRPGLLGDKTAVQELLEGLQEVVGVGGAFLPGILDAGQEGPHVYVVEPWPSGMCLADVFDRRIAQGRTLHAKELLPVVARLDAALAVIPEKWRHGDVRGRQVWIDAGHLLLTGAFLLDAMPTGAVAVVLQTNPSLRPYFAPEVAEGWAAAAADRYGVAGLVWEGLLGEAPPPPGEAGGAVRRLGPLGDVLAQYLAPDPMDRPQSLRPLVDALAKEAGRPAPKIDPAPFRPRRPPSGRRRRHDTIPVPPPSFDADKARRAPSFKEVPAELRTPSAPDPGADEWDAMPTQQFDRSLHASAPAPAAEPRPPAAAKPAPELVVDDDDDEPEVVEVEADEIELDEADLVIAQPHGPQGLPKAKIPIPEGIKGLPRARRPADAPVTRPSNPGAPSVVVGEAARRREMEPAPPEPDVAEATPTPAEAPHARKEPPRGHRREAPTPSSNRSVWLVVLAFVVAAAILVGSLVVAQMRRQQVEQEKQQRIQQRIEQLKKE